MIVTEWTHGMQHAIISGNTNSTGTHIFQEYPSIELYLVGYNAVYFDESQQTFRRNTSPTSSGSKNKPSKQSYACYMLHAGFLCGLLSDPEDGVDIFLRHLGLP